MTTKVTQPGRAELGIFCTVSLVITWGAVTLRQHEVTEETLVLALSVTDCDLELVMLPL